MNRDNNGRKVTWSTVKNRMPIILNRFYFGWAMLSLVLLLFRIQLVSFSMHATWAAVVILSAIGSTLSMFRTEESSKVRSKSCSMLPFSAVLFGIWAICYFYGMGFAGYAAALVAVIPAFIVSFRNKTDGVSGCFFGTAAVLLSAAVIMVCGLDALLSSFVYTETVDEAVSPDGQYYACVYLSDQGALGGDTVVTVRRRKRLLPTALGWLSQVSRDERVYLGDYREAYTLRIRWLDEDTLVINGNKTEMSEFFPS